MFVRRGLVPMLLLALVLLLGGCPSDEPCPTVESPAADTPAVDSPATDAGAGDTSAVAEEVPEFLLIGPVVGNPLDDCQTGPLAPLPDPDGRSFRIAHPSFPGEPFTIPVNTKLGDPAAATPEMKLPLLMELHIDDQPIPTQLTSTCNIEELVNTRDERSVVQIELPISAHPGTDEEPNMALFNNPRFCELGEMNACCVNFMRTGFWRAVVIKPNQVGPGCTLHEVQLAHTYPDELDPRKDVSYRIVGVWSDIDLEVNDRIRFGYWGRVPRRSTELLQHEQPLRPHVRYRLDNPPTCPLRDADAQAKKDCWTLLGDADVEPFTITPDEPAFVHVISPLDAEINRDITVTVVVTDQYGNPTEVAPPLPAWVDVYQAGSAAGNQFCQITTWEQYRGGCTGQLGTEQDVRFGVGLLPPNAVQLYNYTRVHASASHLRKVGDTHIHAGLYRGLPYPRERPSFLRTSAMGDHRADSADPLATLEYLEKVSVYDFGALSYHAIPWAGWQPHPDSRFDRFRNDCGANACECALDPSTTVPEIGDWWSVAQQVSDEYQQLALAANSKFVVYPAFEWHGEHTRWNDQSPLHRVVMYRTLAPLNDHPMLPGSTPDVSPLCLLRYLRNYIELNQLQERDLVVIPHMMKSIDNNLDWDLTYLDFPLLQELFGPLATIDEVESLQTVGEIFSARSEPTVNKADLSTDDLTAFEGTDPANFDVYTYRYGWRDGSAVIGVIGSSDNHTRTPGVNDDRRADGTRYHKHEPTGTAMVLAEKPVGVDERETIFDAIRRRRTYATTGARAWLDFRLEVGGATPDVQMGEVACLTAPATLHGKLMVGANIGRVQVWNGRPGTGTAYQLMVDLFPAAETWTGSLPLAVQPDGERHLYYLRAFVDGTGNPGDPPREVVWSSPIWVDWQATCIP